jgi:ring-1,2-phenylacetyl-CoA epoxidase subunit PaaC
VKRNGRSSAHFEYVLRLGDNALILGQRLSAWCGHAPALEEDLALANISLDLIGQARALLTHAGQLDGSARDEDQLAFLRVEPEYRNVTLVELPETDFAVTVLRNFLFSAFQLQLWQALLHSHDETLAQIAETSLKETRYHLQHSADWVLRLGDGTDDSHARAQAALDDLWPYTAELFTRDAVDDEVASAGLGVTWASLQGDWDDVVRPVLEEATLRMPARTAFLSHGKLGTHSEHMGRLLSEMQYLQRAFPGAQW